MPTRQTKVKIFGAMALAVILAATVLASPAYAASGGRISSGSGFRSSRTSPRYSPSYSRPTQSAPRSYAPRATPKLEAPSRIYTPRTSSTIKGTSIERRSPSISKSYGAPNQGAYRERQTNIVVIPDFSPLVPPPVVYVPTPQPQVVTTPSQSAIEPSKNISNSGKNNWGIFWKLVLVLGVTGAFAYLIFRNSSEIGRSALAQTGVRKIGIAEVKVALLASARDVKEDLERMVEQSDTESSEGLVEILKETALALLRHPDKTIFAYSAHHYGDLPTMEEQYGRMVMEERSKISSELVSNVAGSVHSLSHSIGESEQNSGEYILVSILVAVSYPIPIKGVENFGDLRSNLYELGAVSPDNLEALEIIWQPEGESEVLTQDELLALYPTLTHL